MTRRIIFFLAIAIPIMVVNPANSKGAETPGKELNLQTDRQKSSYSVGYNLGLGVKSIAQEVDLDVVLKGFHDAVLKGGPKIPEPEMKKLFPDFQKKMNEKRQARLGEIAEKNKMEGERFLKEMPVKMGSSSPIAVSSTKYLKRARVPFPWNRRQIKINKIVTVKSY